MATKLEEIFDSYKTEFGILTKLSTTVHSSYEFEARFNETIKKLGQSIFQCIVGEVPKSKNEHITILTSMGDICFPKDHPLASAPSGFKISPYLQENLCRAGTKMVYEEASEEVTKLMGVEVNAKQIERICHHYGALLEEIDWKQAYNDSVQLHLNFSPQKTYAMMDGSMILTRHKKKEWKEVKLCRTFQAEDRLKNISKNRNQILKSNYVAHLGKHNVFLEKVKDILPIQSPLVFICDGARWIWTWVEQNYPDSIQILDLYHCKQNLYEFALKYFHQDKHQSAKWVELCIERLINKDVKGLLDQLNELQCKKRLEPERKKLYKYLKNNKERINYGLYKEQDLLVGSGAIESANRDVIQKRMKLSGQRWTLSGAQQMINLRVCYKSGQNNILKELINNQIQIAC